jgi:predicted phosphoribosyltransferase
MFGAISRRFQLKFKDRAAAGNILAEIVKGRLNKEKSGERIVVLGVPRGGIVTADVVARKLTSSLASSANAAVIDFDIIVPRKLRDQDNKEQAIGAVMEDGTTYLDEELINMLRITQDYLEKEKAEQIQEIRRRITLYSINKTTANHYEHLKDKIAILVDDGAATGATLIAAARWLKRKHTPKRLIIAVPVAPKDTVKLLKREADAVEVVTSPSSIFRSVEQFYQDFTQVPDDKVIAILRDRNMPADTLRR